MAADLWHEDEFARHAKACALTMLGGTNGMPTVRTGLNAKEPWRRFGAIIAIARLGLPETSSEWQLAINDRDPALRRLAREASVGRVVPGLVELLQDSTSEYRSYAARGLMFFRDPGGQAGGKLYMVDITGRVEQPVPTPSFASDPTWSPLLSDTRG